jgi:hypothetical protein
MRKRLLDKIFYPSSAEPSYARKHNCGPQINGINFNAIYMGSLDMPKNLLIVLYLFLHSIASAQPPKPLLIEISFDTSKSQNFAIYNIRLSNYSDSIICVLRSPTIVLGIGFEPQRLVSRSADGVGEMFDLEWSAADTSNVYEGPLYRGVPILPRQALYFKIEIPASKKAQYLSVEYVNTYDLCYKSFINSMKDAFWFKKYPLYSEQIAISSKIK